MIVFEPRHETRRRLSADEKQALQVMQVEVKRIVTEMVRRAEKRALIELRSRFDAAVDAGQPLDIRFPETRELFLEALRVELEDGHGGSQEGEAGWVA